MSGFTNWRKPFGRDSEADRGHGSGQRGNVGWSGLDRGPADERGNVFRHARAARSSNCNVDSGGMDLPAAAGGIDVADDGVVPTEGDFFCGLRRDYVARSEVSANSVRGQFYRLFYRLVLDGGAVPEAPVL